MTVGSFSDNVFYGCPSASARYDWVPGTCSVTSSLPCGGGPEFFATVEAKDSFYVTGLPPGTPLTIHARIHVTAFAEATNPFSASVFSRGWLREAGAGSVDAHASSGYLQPPESIDETRTLDFPNLAGAEFLLAMGARCDTDGGDGSVSVALSFPDLPPGALVHSCNGYLSGPPVGTRRSSWGAIKLHYR